MNTWPGSQSAECGLLVQDTQTGSTFGFYWDDVFIDLSLFAGGFEDAVP